MAVAGYVYVVHAVGMSYVKIGKTTNFFKRFQQLQRGTLFPLQILSVARVPDMDREERELHALYQRYHVRGEWYNAPPDMLLHFGIGVAPEPSSHYALSPLQMAIVQFLEQQGELKTEKIFAALGPSKHSYAMVRKSLMALARNGTIQRVRHGYYCLPANATGFPEEL
jgi:hypothetical protein